MINNTLFDNSVLLKNIKISLISIFLYFNNPIFIGVLKFQKYSIHYFFLLIILTVIISKIFFDDKFYKIDNWFTIMFSYFFIYSSFLVCSKLLLLSEFFNIFYQLNDIWEFVIIPIIIFHISILYFGNVFSQTKNMVFFVFLVLCIKLIIGHFLGIILSDNVTIYYPYNFSNKNFFVSIIFFIYIIFFKKFFELTINKIKSIKINYFYFNKFFKFLNLIFTHLLICMMISLFILLVFQIIYGDFRLLIFPIIILHIFGFNTFLLKYYLKSSFIINFINLILIIFFNFIILKHSIYEVFLK